MHEFVRGIGIEEGSYLAYPKEKYIYVPHHYLINTYS